VPNSTPPRVINHVVGQPQGWRKTFRVSAYRNHVTDSRVIPPTHYIITRGRQVLDNQDSLRHGDIIEFHAQIPSVPIDPHIFLSRLADH
jgi:hypothetical protein